MLSLWGTVSSFCRKPAGSPLIFPALTSDCGKHTILLIIRIFQEGWTVLGVCRRLTEWPGAPFSQLLYISCRTLRHRPQTLLCSKRKQPEWAGIKELHSWGCGILWIHYAMGCKYIKAFNGHPPVEFWHSWESWFFSLILDIFLSPWFFTDIVKTCDHSRYGQDLRPFQHFPSI